MASDDFLDSKVAEFLAAKEAGDQQAMVRSLREALSESTGSMTDRLLDMGSAAKRQQGEN